MSTTTLDSNQVIKKVYDEDSESLNVNSGIGSEGTGVASSTVTAVPSSATNVTLLAANPDRKLFLLFNDSTQICFVKFGATATSGSYTVKMAAGSLYESFLPVYTGRIDAIWASANGNMLVTEVE